MAWFAVRSIFVLDARGESEDCTYEERVRLFDAADADAAIARSEVEAAEYAAGLDGCTALGFHQSFELFDAPGDGSEVFSLMRDSDLEPDDYLDRFFDTGTERQGRLG